MANGTMALNNAHHFVMEGVSLTEIRTQITNETYVMNIAERKKSLSPVRNVPPSTSQNFTGQEEYLEKLNKHFDIHGYSVRKMYLLYGMGGIGKTQICLKFKEDVSDKYAHVFWIDATSDDTIEQSLKDIYKTHAASMPQGNSFSSALVLQWISVLGGKWMIIYDNADGSPNVLQKFIPPGNKGHILISSRNPEQKSVVSPKNSLEVNVMHKDIAIELLLKASGLHDEAEKYYNSASEICSKLHFLPLAIDQAGAYINAGRCRIDKYTSMYDKYSQKLMDNNSFKGASKYNKTVYGTWELSFQKIKDMTMDMDNEENAQAAKYAIILMNMCAFLHHENISDIIFERAAEQYHTHLEHWKDETLPMFIPNMDISTLNFDDLFEWNLMQYHESIAILMSFSLIKRAADGEKFGLHPLVQKWCQDRLNKKQKQLWIHNARGVILSSTSKDKTTSEYIYMNSLHLHIIQNLLTDKLESIIYYHDIFQLLENLLFVNGKYDMHHIISQRIFEKSRETYGDDHLNTLSSKSTLAISNAKMWNFVEAERLHMQVLKIRSKILGTDHPDTLASMTNLAQAYFLLGKYTEAEMVGLEALELRCQVLGTEHPDTFTSSEILAAVYNQLGKYKEAERLMIQGLEMRKKVLGPEHPDTARGIADLAIMYNQLGKNIEAEKLNMQVLDIRSKILGTGHPETLTSMAILTFTYHTLGKYTEAERLGMQVVEMGSRILGTEHPDTLSCMAILATAYHKLEKYADAEGLLMHVADLRSRVLGTEHPNTIKSMADLAITYSHLGKYIEAEQLHMQVVEMRSKILGTEHPDTVKNIADLAITYRKLGNYTDAEKLELQVLEIRKRLLGTEHPDTLTSMANLAVTYYDIGSYADAEQLEVQVLEMRKIIFGTEHQDTLTSMDNLAYTYHAIGRYTDAEKLRVQVLKMSGRILGTLGKFTEAAELEMQLVDMEKHGK